MNIFFTADQHFGHANIIKHAKRPFADVTEMDHRLIDAWNARVTNRDLVYHLGDFAWRTGKVAAYAKQLKGAIILIRGNHDPKLGSINARMPVVHDVRMIRAPPPDGHEIWLSHYAHRVWPKSGHGSYHLYGHSHGGLPDNPHALSMDVGVDTRPDFAPYSLDEIVAAMAKKTFKPVDHHGRSTDD